MGKLWITLTNIWLLQGLMDHHEEIVEYFNRRGFLQYFSFGEIYCAEWSRFLLILMIGMLSYWMEPTSHMYIQKKRSLTLYIFVCTYFFLPPQHSKYWILVGDFLYIQADTLSKYKPMINCTKLITDLKEMELTAAKAIEYFNSTRHMVLYYEDIVRNRTVRIFRSIIKSYLLLINCYHIFQLIV